MPLREPQRFTAVLGGQRLTGALSETRLKARLSEAVGVPGPPGPPGAPGEPSTILAPVGTEGELPPEGERGELVLTEDSGDLWSWNTPANTGTPARGGPDQQDVYQWINVGHVVGPPGADGAPGPMGPQGPIGETGAQGEPGLEGPEGPEGPPGDTGPQGPQGETGPAGPQGAAGQSAGRIFYYAPSDASDISGYKTLLESPSPGAEVAIPVTCTGTADVLVGNFVTEPGVPGEVPWPAGTVFRRIFAAVSGGSARLHVEVYKRASNGAETLVRSEFSPPFTNTAAALQDWTVILPYPGIAMTATDRLVSKVYAARVSGPGSITVTCWFEGQYGSHIQTTISAGAQGPPGPPGPQTPWTSHIDGAGFELRNAGRVGIGTAAPASRISLGDASPNITQRIALWEYPGGVSFRGIGMANPMAGVWGVGVYAMSAGMPTDTNMALFVRDGGNVGIGTASPNWKLSLSNSEENLKLAVVDNGAESYGFGCAPGILRYAAGANGNHVFYTGSGQERLRIAASGNIGVGTPDQFGVGFGVIGIHNCAVAPTANPVGGGILYVENGALKYRGSNGTTTIIAPA